MTLRLLRFLPLAVAAVLASAAPSPAGEVRVITAPGLTPAPTFETSPQRVERPRPVTPAAPIAERRLGPVVVESGERILAHRLAIRLPGVAAVGLDASCRDTAGVEWPCGRRALAGLRALLRLRPVTCPLPADARSGDWEAACAFGPGRDLGEAFVASGWARADGDTYAAAEAAAKRDGRGIWGPAPTPGDALPDFAAPTATLPPDLTTAPLADGGAASATREATPAEGAGAPMRVGR